MAGVPVAPGTEVDVTISPKVRSGEPAGRCGFGRRARSDARPVPDCQAFPQYIPDTAYELHYRGEVMKAHVLRGSKQEIAEGLARILGEVRAASLRHAR